MRRRARWGPKVVVVRPMPRRRVMTPIIVAPMMAPRPIIMAHPQPVVVNQVEKKQIIIKEVHHVHSHPAMPSAPPQGYPMYPSLPSPQQEFYNGVPVGQAPPPIPPPNCPTPPSTYPTIQNPQCKSWGIFYSPEENHQCMKASPQKNLVGKELTITRRSSAPSGKIQKWEYDKICSIPKKEIYIGAWIELNLGFLERYKKIKTSIGNKFEHLKGKKWNNVKKMWPKIEYKEFMQNVNYVQEEKAEEWERLKQGYLISKVSQIGFRHWVFCDRNFLDKDVIWLLPCMDVVHYDWLKKRFKGFIFFYQKAQRCTCGMDMQENYAAIRAHIISKKLLI
jgi:hypothetical protein